jgi:hypothetical protein
MIQLSERYRPRHIRFLELWEIDGWRLKVYGISRDHHPPGDALLSASHRFAKWVLRRPAITAERYGVGFIGVHAGRNANLVFVGWWGRENELHHHVAISPLDRPVALRPTAPGELTACVWDAAVICFERGAWVDYVLAAPQPNLDDYLGARLEAVV